MYEESDDVDESFDSEISYIVVRDIKFCSCIHSKLMIY